MDPTSSDQTALTPPASQARSRVKFVTGTPLSEATPTEDLKRTQNPKEDEDVRTSSMRIAEVCLLVK